MIDVKFDSRFLIIPCPRNHPGLFIVYAVYANVPYSTDHISDDSRYPLIPGVGVYDFDGKLTTTPKGNRLGTIVEVIPYCVKFMWF